MRQVHQHGAAGDQTRTTVSHPAGDAEPEWHEMNCQPKKKHSFTENPGPVGDGHAAALESEQPADFELLISDVLIQNIVDQTYL